MARSVLIGVATAVAAVVVIGWLVLRDTTTPVEADAIATRFTGTPGDAPGEPGLYRYATVGFETVDALQGSRHDYPSESYMTLQIEECGPVVRWDALAERWIEWRHCGPDLGIDATNSYHEWFGIPDLEEEFCSEPRLVSGAPGEGVQATCVAGADTEIYEIGVVGVEAMVIGDMTVTAVHTRTTSTLSGSSSGTATIETWRLEGTPLILRMDVVRDSVSPSPAGPVAYHEEFTLNLVDPMPSGG